MFSGSIHGGGGGKIREPPVMKSRSLFWTYLDWQAYGSVG